MELILTLLIPAATSLYTLPFLEKSKWVRKLPGVLRLCLSIGVGVSAIIVVLSLWGMLMPYGFSILAKSLFGISLFSSGLLLFSKPNIFKNIVSKATKLARFATTDICFVIIALFIFFYIFLFAFRPVVDSDVIDSYLPLARSILIEDKIPTHNHFDERPFIIPPVGGPTLFAYYYTIAGNLKSEPFRFINLPFFIGFLIISYFILKEYESSKLSRIGLTLLLISPIMEDLVFTAGLYPDFIGSFLTVLIFWLTTRILQAKVASQPKIAFIFIGLFLACSLLIKYQAFFIYLLVILLFIPSMFSTSAKFALLPVVYIPLFIGFVYGKTPFQIPSAPNSLVFLLLASFITFKFINQYSLKKIKARYFVLMVFIALLGSIFLLRNYMVFGGIEEKAPNRNWAMSTEYELGVAKEGGDILEAWSFFLAPYLLLSLLIPRVIGLWVVLRTNRFLLPTSILLIFYSYWVLFLGAADYKWLLPILPYVILITLQGLKKLFSNNIISVAVASLPFFLLSSKFIFWNLGVLTIGAPNLLIPDKAKAILEIVPSAVALIPKESIEVMTNLTYLLTSRIPLRVQDLPLLLAFSILSFIGLKTMVRLNSKLHLSKLLPILLVSIYVYTIWTVSGGRLSQFERREQDYLFSYWGQNTHVTPYLSANALPQDVILQFSVPTGLSYYTFLKVYNLEYGGGLAIIRPIFDEEDLERVYLFLKNRNVSFILIRDYGESKDNFARLKKLTSIFDMLENTKYTREILHPSGSNYWYFYKLL